MLVCVGVDACVSESEGGGWVKIDVNVIVRMINGCLDPQSDLHTGYPEANLNLNLYIYII